VDHEIRNNPLCDSVQDVGIVPAPEQPPPHLNWRVMWTLAGEPIAPASAPDIERGMFRANLHSPNGVRAEVAGGWMGTVGTHSVQPLVFGAVAP
jgi:hypothetical protein